MTEPAFLIDSNICIYHLRGASRALLERLITYRGRVVTSSVCYAEVMLGICRAEGEPGPAAMALFSEVQVLPFDREAADVYARLPFRRRGFDRLIAAHALALNATLVTNNPRDFEDIPNLRVENWL